MAMLHSVLSLRGRLPRRRCLGHSLLLLLGVLAVVLAALGLGAAEHAGLSGLAFLLVLAAVPLALWCALSLTVKRLHDLGLSGWHAAWIMALNLISSLLPAGAVLALIPMLVWLGLLLLPGSAGANRFGPPAARFTPPDARTGW